MEQGHDIPAEFLRCPGGKSGIEIPGDGKERTDDVVGLELVRLNQGAQQLVGGRENFTGIIAGHRGGAADPL